MSRQEAVERAAWCLAMDTAEAEERAIDLEPGLVCVSSPERGVGSVLVDEGGETLFFPSNIGVEEAREAFVGGRRTELAKFEGLRADLLRDREPRRPLPSEADRAVVSDWSSLPGSSGMVFRGVPADAAFVEEGTTVMATQVVRAARDPRRAAAGAVGLYCILGEDARSLDGHASLADVDDEGIVAFRPGSRFRVVHTVATTPVAHLVLESGLGSRTSLDATAELVEQFERDVVPVVEQLDPGAHPDGPLQPLLVGDIG